MRKNNKKEENFYYKTKKGQLSLFIIIAIVIVFVLLLFFFIKGVINKVPKEFENVYSYYISCVKEETKNGLKILGEKGGRIKEIEFSPGSVFMPFSNHLGFMDQGIPYWYYISGNGVSKEQVPSKSKMESDLNDFVKEGIKECDFSQFEKEDFNVTIGEVENIKTEIKNDVVKVNLKQKLEISSKEKKIVFDSHGINVDSNLGNFYNLALDIYNREKENLFLENYSLDIIRLYAPVDGSEISCSPKVWDVNDVRMNLSNALEANLAAIKIRGNYYRLKNEENKYFIQDISKKNNFNVNFMYSKYWPTKIEIWPSENGVLRADPIGLEEGLGVIGFCYVPYHFVYDLYYPVLIQIYAGDELFQFPVVVSIDKTKPKKSLEGSSLPDVVPELCQHKLTKMEVYTYNTKFEPVEADIKFKCFDTVCDIGKTEIKNSEAVLVDNFPQCLNGFIIASADGYDTKKEIVSTVNSGSANLIMSKKYKLKLIVHERGSEIEGYALVIINKDGETRTFSYPEMKEIELTEGQYKIKVYVYSNKSIYLKSNPVYKCVDVPKSGLAGMFGAKEQRCFNLYPPDQEINFVVSGGGVVNYYFPESELEKSKTLLINTDYFGLPNSIEDLQKNFNTVEVSSLNVQLEE